MSCEHAHVELCQSELLARSSNVLSNMLRSARSVERPDAGSSDGAVVITQATCQSSVVRHIVKAVQLKQSLKGAGVAPLCALHRTVDH